MSRAVEQAREALVQIQKQKDVLRQKITQDQLQQQQKKQAYQQQLASYTTQFKATIREPAADIQQTLKANHYQLPRLIKQQKNLAAALRNTITQLNGLKKREIQASKKVTKLEAITEEAAQQPKSALLDLSLHAAKVNLHTGATELDETRENHAKIVQQQSKLSCQLQKNRIACKVLRKVIPLGIQIKATEEKLAELECSNQAAWQTQLAELEQKERQAEKNLLQAEIAATAEQATRQVQTLTLAEEDERILYDIDISIAEFQGLVAEIRSWASTHALSAEDRDELAALDEIECVISTVRRTLESNLKMANSEPSSYWVNRVAAYTTCERQLKRAYGIIGDAPQLTQRAAQRARVVDTLGIKAEDAKTGYSCRFVQGKRNHPNTSFTKFSRGFRLETRNAFQCLFRLCQKLKQALLRTSSTASAVKRFIETPTSSRTRLQRARLDILKTTEHHQLAAKKAGEAHTQSLQDSREQATPQLSAGA